MFYPGTPDEQLTEPNSYAIGNLIVNMIYLIKEIKTSRFNFIL
jgi:hypothetical protein